METLAIILIGVSWFCFLLFLVVPIFEDDYRGIGFVLLKVMGSYGLLVASVSQKHFTLDDIGWDGLLIVSAALSDLLMIVSPLLLLHPYAIIAAKVLFPAASLLVCGIIIWMIRSTSSNDSLPGFFLWPVSFVSMAVGVNLLP